MHAAHDQCRALHCLLIIICNNIIIVPILAKLYTPVNHRDIADIVEGKIGPKFVTKVTN